MIVRAYHETQSNSCLYRGLYFEISILCMWKYHFIIGFLPLLYNRRENKSVQNSYFFRKPLISAENWLPYLPDILDQESLTTASYMPRAAHNCCWWRSRKSVDFFIIMFDSLIFKKWTLNQNTTFGFLSPDMCLAVPHLTLG